MTTNNPQVPWTEEQWTRVNQVVQEEAGRARVAATFLPLIGPLSGDTDFVRRERITYPARIAIDDRRIWQLATLQVRVRARGAQMADPDMTSVLAMFRRAANVLARLEDAVVFRGLVPGPPVTPAGGAPAPMIWEITGGEAMYGLWRIPWQVPLSQRVRMQLAAPADTELVIGIAAAIGRLEATGHFGPFAVVLDQRLFLVAQTPAPTLVLPQDRITPFLGGGPLLRSSTLDARGVGEGNGVVVALGGAPVELVIATDVCVQFLQVTAEPEFLFRVCEKMVLRIKEPEAIMQLERW
jgi:uncharacterized linocin/CFP29 family protein